MPSSPIRALAFAVLFALLPLPPSVLAAKLARQAADAAGQVQITTIYFWKNENPTPARS